MEPYMQEQQEPSASGVLSRRGLGAAALAVTGAVVLGRVAQLTHPLTTPYHTPYHTPYAPPKYSLNTPCTPPVHPLCTPYTPPYTWAPRNPPPR